ncbi:hypothetical protein TNCV_4049921 [Trichonephila clavipes]|nr:hypothetical protein TNCV_4049921 [Trichonephila clavipes]
MARRKVLSLDRIVNLLREISENESNDGELSCSNLGSDEDIRLSESDCEESEENADIIDNIPENHDCADIKPIENLWGRRKVKRSDRCSSHTNLRLQVHRTKGDKDQWPNGNPGYIRT